jgi:UDPglucose 6-dehydrogenase
LIDKGSVGIVTNPEFLREGSAIDDILDPHLIVIGQYDRKTGNELESYYRQFYKTLPEIIHTDIASAELIKYANNAFLATKISFINSLANICQNLPGTDINTIAKAIGKDPRIGSLFLQAGPGFGGSCLPKDISGLINFSNKFEKTNELFKAVLRVNQNQPVKVLELLKKFNIMKKNNTISILGLAFKKDTDDIREAVSIEIVKLLLKKGLKLKVYDPMAMDNFRKLFKEKITYCSTIDECLRNSDCCFILTEWDSFQKLKPEKFKKLMKKANVIDARRILDPKKFSDINFKAIGLGN